MVIGYLLRGYVSYVHLYLLPIMLIYVLYALTSKKHDYFPHLEMTYNWLSTATYVTVTNWFIIREKLLEDIEDAIQASMNGYDILLYKLSPCEIHVYFNNGGYYNHFVYRVYVTKINIWFSKYVIVMDMVEGYDFRRFFYAFCDQMKVKKYKTESKKRLNLGLGPQLLPFIDLSENAIDDVIRNAVNHIKNNNTAVGLNILINVIDNKDFIYLVHRHKIVELLESVIFSATHCDEHKLLAITAIRLLTENKNTVVFLNVHKYQQLTRPMYELKMGPYEKCPYFHGSVKVEKAKDLLQSPMKCLIFSYGEMTYIIYNLNSKFIIEKIEYDEKLFYIKKKGYKSVDEYVTEKRLTPLIQPTMPLIIALEALRVIKPASV